MNNIYIILKANLVFNCFCVWRLASMYVWLTSLYIWYNTSKRGGNKNPCMTRCFLCQMCHLTLTENWNTWQKWLKLDLLEASVLVININVHPAAVKGRGDQLDSWDAYAWLLQLLCFVFLSFCFLGCPCSCCTHTHTAKLTFRHTRSEAVFPNLHMETVKQMYFWAALHTWSCGWTFYPNYFPTNACSLPKSPWLPPRTPAPSDVAIVCQVGGGGECSGGGASWE